MTMIPPPGYIFREKAERIDRNLREGLRDICDRTLARLQARVHEIAAERDAEAIKAILKSETDVAVAEIDALREVIRLQLESTEH
jgi:hypothetical protein